MEGEIDIQESEDEIEVAKEISRAEFYESLLEAYEFFADKAREASNKMRLVRDYAARVQASEALGQKMQYYKGTGGQVFAHKEEKEPMGFTKYGK